MSCLCEFVFSVELMGIRPLWLRFWCLCRGNICSSDRDQKETCLSASGFVTRQKGTAFPLGSILFLWQVFDSDTKRKRVTKLRTSVSRSLFVQGSSGSSALNGFACLFPGTLRTDWSWTSSRTSTTSSTASTACWTVPPWFDPCAKTRSTCKASGYVCSVESDSPEPPPPPHPAQQLRSSSEPDKPECVA